MSNRAVSGPDADPRHAIEWLLASPDPSVRLLTLIDVLEAPPTSTEVLRTRDEIPHGPRVRRLLTGQRPDGGFGVHPYRKWTGAHWRLVSLVELGLAPGHPSALAAVETVLSWLTSEPVERSIDTVGGRVRLHASIEGNAVAVCCRLGVAHDGRVRRLVDRLLGSQWPDGGWNCDPSPSATHSSFHESLPALWGLIEFAQATGDRESRQAADRTVELLLAHRLFRSHRTGRVADHGWLRLHYPPYWHYDVLQALLILGRWGALRDPRAGDALDLLEGMRRKDGRWNASGRRFWRPPGSGGSNEEIVDWSPARPSEMVTLNALRVLRAARRL